MSQQVEQEKPIYPRTKGIVGFLFFMTSYKTVTFSNGRVVRLREDTPAEKKLRQENWLVHRKKICIFPTRSDGALICLMAKKRGQNLTRYLTELVRLDAAILE